MNKPAILGLISARGGSKGIPRKNIRPMAGKPLIAWTIAEGLKSAHIDRLIVSTDDEEIAAVAREHGAEVPFMRPAELASDTASGIDPVLHALDVVKPNAANQDTAGQDYDYVVLLQPTSPLRTAEDIDNCIDLCLQKNADCCVSVAEAATSPYLTFTLQEDGRMRHILKREEGVAVRQQIPTAYAPNGAIFMAKADWLRSRKLFLTEETVGFVMDRSRSVDVDDLFDFEVCELLLKSRLRADD